MNFVDSVFLVYMFVGLYMLSLLILIYLPNRKRMYGYPRLQKEEGVSLVMPCYNEEKEIGAAIESLLAMDWPREKMEIIVVDDKSSDNSVEIVRKFARKYKNVRLIVLPENSGGAAVPTNTGVKAARFSYIAVTDADSTPSPDALRKMIGHLQADKKVGAVTCAVLSKSPGNFMQRLQAIEYAAIAFSRRLLDLVDSVYVTPGPFALYRKKDLVRAGLFDPTNMTQDIEIVWRMLSKGYMARMCLDAQVRSATPETFRGWWKQRIRWNIGGKQTLWKYKGLVFRKGILGLFIIPFFSASLFIGLFGLGFFVYLMSRRLLVSYFSTAYSLAANTAVLHLQDLSFAPSVLNYFGVILFVLGAAFTLFGLSVIERDMLKWKHTVTIFFYLIVYLAVYPFLLVVSLWKMFTGNYSW